MPLGLFTRGKPAVDSQSIGKQGDYAPAEKPEPVGDSLAQALQQGRLGQIILHGQQWVDNPHFEKALEDAFRAVDEHFAMVPEGVVSLPLTIFDQPGQPEKECATEPYLLARGAVTNAQYQHFVDAGGYEDLGLWPEDIWPHLIGFKDGSDRHAPRFWKKGRHDKRLGNHPVVGICYYEAVAYASWVGSRVPSESEWQTAASWRMRSSAQTERRYPWGDSLDLHRCNIWACGRGGTLAVDACPEGAAPNGVLQLIGNVWEWTASGFESTDREGRDVVGDTLLKGIRGGAYDTYFPWQATSDFRTGLGCLMRVHNVGLRCAMDVLES